jgi:hypothetical protein
MHLDDHDKHGFEVQTLEWERHVFTYVEVSADSDTNLIVSFSCHKEL